MPKKKHTTIQEVAKFAGVSPITASRALNNPKLVKDATRRRVVLAAKELNFIPTFCSRHFIER
jgi:LacI family gluconate utilization system Gnt-I transcriptional repressor